MSTTPTPPTSRRGTPPPPSYLVLTHFYPFPSFGQPKRQVPEGDSKKERKAKADKPSSVTSEIAETHSKVAAASGKAGGDRGTTGAVVADAKQEGKDSLEFPPSVPTPLVPLGKGERRGAGGAKYKLIESDDFQLDAMASSGVPERLIVTVTLPKNAVGRRAFEAQGLRGSERPCTKERSACSERAIFVVFICCGSTRQRARVTVFYHTPRCLVGTETMPRYLNGYRWFAHNSTASCLVLRTFIFRFESILSDIPGLTPVHAVKHPAHAYGFVFSSSEAASLPPPPPPPPPSSPPLPPLKRCPQHSHSFKLMKGVLFF